MKKINQLILLYLLVFIFLLINVILFIKLNTQSIERYNYITDTFSKKLSYVSEMRKNSEEIQIQVFKHTIDTSVTEKIKAEKIIDDLVKSNNEISEQFQNIANNDELLFLKTLVSLRENNRIIRKKLFDLSYSTGIRYETPIHYQQTVQQQTYENYHNSINKLSNYVAGSTNKKVDDVNKFVKKSKPYILISIFFLLSILVLLGIMIRNTLKHLSNQNKDLIDKDHILESEIKFSESIISAAPDGIVGVNNKGEIILFNKEAEYIFGYSYEEIYGKNISILIPEKFHERHEVHLGIFLKNPKEIHVNNREIPLFGIRKNGEIFPAEINLSYIQTNKGEIALADVKDISQKKIAEKKIFQLTEILKSSTTFVGFADMNRNLMYLNESFKTALGLTLEEDISKYKITDFRPELAFNRMEDVMQIVFSTGKWVGESAVISKAGKIIPVFQTILLHYDVDGKPEYTSTTMVDITELKQKETRLLSINKLHEAIAKASKTLLFVKDKEELYASICNIIVEIAGMKLVWIGEPDSDSNIIEFKSNAGNTPEYLQGLVIRYDLPFSELTPSATCFISGHPCIINDYRNEPKTKDWHDKALKAGIESVAIFPIKIKEKITGILTVYASNKDFFQQEEIFILTEMTSMISLALEKLEQEKLNEEIDIQRKQLTDIIEYSPVGISLSDMERRFVYVNPAGKTDFFQSNDEDVSLTFTYDLYPDETKEIVDTIVLPTLLKEGIWQGELELYNKHKEKLQCLLVAVLHKDQYGKPVLISNTLLDISPLKRQEKEVKKLADIIQHSNAFIGITDKNGNIIYANDSLRNSLGILPDEDITKLYTSEFDISSEIPLEELITILKKKGIWMGERELLSRNGKTIPVIQVIVMHRDENGEPEFYSYNAIDISELKEKENELIKQTEGLRSLSNRLQSIREEERKLIAKEIHDELGQNLTALKIKVSWLKNHTDIDKDELIKKLSQFELITNDTINTSRSLYNSIYPQMLKDVGIKGALQWHADTFLTPAKIDFEVQSKMDDDLLLDYENISLVLYRIYQECCTNIIRYAKANLVIVELIEVSGYIRMNIIDDGIGFDTDKVDTKLHHGLMGMKERVFALNGLLTIESEIGNGTTTRVSIPLSKASII